MYIENKTEACHSEKIPITINLSPEIELCLDKTKIELKRYKKTSKNRSKKSHHKKHKRYYSSDCYSYSSGDDHVF